MEKINVGKIPSNLMKNLFEKRCAEPNQCFRNCALAVSNFDLADTYVLCFAEDHHGNFHGHAIIKIDEKYFDPTLEMKPGWVKGYWAHTEMTKHELREFVMNWYQGIEANEDGEVEVYPPALLKSGEIACQKVELA